MLEKLGDTKEKSRSFLSGESLSGIQQVDDPSQECPTLPRGDRRFIECPSFLNDGGFIVVERYLSETFLQTDQGTYRVRLILRPS